MELDLEYALGILQQMSDNENATFRPEDFPISDEEAPKFYYHCRLLMQAGFIEIWEFGNLRTLEECYPKTMTWDGHDFLATSYPEKVRAPLGEMIKTQGLGFSLTTIKTLAPDVIRKIIGE